MSPTRLLSAVPFFLQSEIVKTNLADSAFLDLSTRVLYSFCIMPGSGTHTAESYQRMLPASNLFYLAKYKKILGFL